MDADEAWESVGKCGYFQIMSYILLGLAITYSAMPQLSFSFTAEEVDHRCLIPECETSSNFQFDSDFLKFTIPLENKNNYVRDKRFQPKIPNGNCNPTNFETTKTINCEEWVWKPPNYSLLREWEFTGQTHKEIKYYISIINNVGQISGYFIIGLVSDEIGRKTTLIYSCLLSSSFGLIRSFSPNIELFFLFEYLDLVSAVGIYSCGVVLALEIVTTPWRIIGGALGGIYFSFGFILLGVLGLLVPNWRMKLIYITVPGLCLFFTNWFLPDSIIWLISRGKNEEATAILYRAARLNKVPLTDEVRESIHSSISRISLNFANQEVVNTDVLMKKLLKSKILLLRLVIACFCWVTSSLVYYGLSLFSMSLEQTGDKNLNFILVNSVDIFAYLIIIFGSKYFARKILGIVTFSISGVSVVLSIFPTEDLIWLGIIFYLIARIAITIAFINLHVHVTELFPTPIRHSCYGFCSMIGQGGSLMAPLILYFTVWWEHIPLIIFASTSLLSAFLNVFLPETRYSDLPATIEEAENLGKENQTDILAYEI